MEHLLNTSMNDGEDRILSQVLDEIETFCGDDIVLSQALDELEQSELMDSTITDSQVRSILKTESSDYFETFGDFILHLPSGDKCEVLDVAAGSDDRFGKIITSECDSLILEQKSKNTERSTRASSVFDSWKPARIKHGEVIPPLLRHKRASFTVRTVHSFV